MGDLGIKDQKVILRVDFNVPLAKDNSVTDESRIIAALPTIKHLLDNNCALIILSHLGRPQKKKNPDGSINTEAFSLKHILPNLRNHLNKSIGFSDITDRRKCTQDCKSLALGEIILLENTRFDPGEESGDHTFSQWLSELGEVFVNEAFGTAHRAHASTAIIAEYFKKENKFLGFLVQRELAEAKKLTENYSHPYTAIIGGAKVSDKIVLLEKLIDRVDNILIGGGMAYTFIKATGGKVAMSLVEDDKIDMAAQILEKAKHNNTHIFLPTDSIVADAFSNDANCLIAPSHDIPEGYMGLDIGPKAISEYSEVLKKSKTIFWNGPMGVFEMESFENGTKSIAMAAGNANKAGAYVSVGGGDSVAAIVKFGLQDQADFLSTGGGAMLKLLEGKELPGIKSILA